MAALRSSIWTSITSAPSPATSCGIPAASTSAKATSICRTLAPVSDSIDKDDKCVAHLGDGKGVKKAKLQAGPGQVHHLMPSRGLQGNLYVLEWVPYGRVRKFAHAGVR